MKKLIYLLVFVLIIIQFFQIEKVNPPVNKGTDFLNIKKTPENTAAQIRSSCYDCHSDETSYPWYSYIQPFGWFLKSHIDEGRKKLNFSVYANYDPTRQAHKMDEAAELTGHGAMPLESYLLIHQDARLTDEQRNALTVYFRKIEEDTRATYGLAPEPVKKPEK